MAQKILNQCICIKQYIYPEDYKKLHELEEFCKLKDKTNLKLELDFKQNMYKNSTLNSKNNNEFLYYIDDVLVSYLSISCFGGNIGELNGMTHPDWRRKGLFSKLFKLAIDECKKRNFDKILLLSDKESNSGIKFIESVGSYYDFGEYRMKCTNKSYTESISSVKLREAEALDRKEISRQNVIFFNDVEDSEDSSIESEEENPDDVVYIIQLDSKTIGKIAVKYYDDNTSAFIHGFGILPDYRGKGYGKSALKEVLHLIHEKNIFDIELDVECKNDTALNLYKVCGFVEKSVMNYYKFNFN